MIFKRAILVCLLLLPGGALSAQPQRSALFFVQKGEASFAAGEYRTAAAHFRDALQKNSGFLPAHLGAARSYYSLGDLRRARVHFLRALELEKDNKAAMTGLALVQIDLGDFPSARELLDRVRELAAGDAYNNYALGVFHRRLNHLELAEGYLRKALRVRPAYAPALVELARVLADQDRMAEAEASLERARRVQPVYPGIYVARGNLRFVRPLPPVTRKTVAFACAGPTKAIRRLIALRRKTKT